MAKRKTYSASFKSKVALEALRGEMTIAELASKYGVNPVMVTRWKKQAVDGKAETFSKRGQASRDASNEAQNQGASRQDRRVDGGKGFFVQGLRPLSHVRRMDIIDSKHHRLSIVKQCSLMSVSRSSFYYQAKGEFPFDLRLMRLIDEQWLKTPFSAAAAWPSIYVVRATIQAAKECVV